MLDEAVQQRDGGFKGNQNALKDKSTVDIINSRLKNKDLEEIVRPTGTSRAAGRRKLRKYAEEREDVASEWAQVFLWYCLTKEGRCRRQYNYLGI